jgi:hypothetical protein
MAIRRRHFAGRFGDGGLQIELNLSATRRLIRQMAAET